MKTNPYLTTMIALATTAFGLLAAGAWNTAISDLLKEFIGKEGGIIGELVYAVIVTVVAIVVINNLAKLADKDQSIIK